MSFAHHHPHGSARYAEAAEIARAFAPRGGIPFAFYKGRKLFHSKNAGILLVGGAGSGKFTSVLGHIIDAPGRNGEPARYAIFDPKREIRAVLGPYFAHIGAAVYEVNPYATHGATGHKISLMAHLVPNAPTLVADTRRAAQTFVPESGGGDAKFFEQKAQNWLDPMMRGLVHLDGGVSPASLYELVSIVRADPELWRDMAAMMADLGEPDLKVAYAEMIEMASESRRTFDSVLSEITNAVSVMNDPLLQAAFVTSAEADFTLDVLCEDHSRPVFVFCVIPPELTIQTAPLIRQFFSSLRTIKQRKPEAPTLNLVIDEAAQLGPFREIAEFYSVGRGFGLSPMCVYQDIGQIKKNLGPTGATTLSASADIEVYLGGGISDLDTAQHLSAKLGSQTLVLDDRLTQARAQRGKREAMHAALFQGADPVRTGLAIRALDYESQHIRSQSRRLLTPDEVLRLPQDKALVMASGYGIPPILAEKKPYFGERAYAGKYGPNPYFDKDLDVIRVRERFRYRKRRVVTEDVPASHAHLPQYRGGTWRYVEGYRPKELEVSKGENGD